MKLTIYGFLVCLVLTIPTMGISLVLYFAAKYFIDQAGVEKLSIAIESSRNSNNSARVVIYVNNAAIKSFFKKHGTTQTKYKHTDGISKGMFSGYVNVENSGEVVVTMIKNSTSIIIACYDPPQNFGSDLLSLMQKQGFHDQVVDLIVKGNVSDN